MKSRPWVTVQVTRDPFPFPKTGSSLNKYYLGSLGQWVLTPGPYDPQSRPFPRLMRSLGWGEGKDKGEEEGSRREGDMKGAGVIDNRGKRNSKNKTCAPTSFGSDVKGQRGRQPPSIPLT